MSLEVNSELVGKKLTKEEERKAELEALRKQERSELIVDVGRYRISYSIHSYTGDLMYYTSEFTSKEELLLSKQGTSFLANIVFKVKKLKSEYTGIDKLILVIPTNDMLIKQEKEISLQMLIDIMVNKYGITDEDGLIVAMGKPYRYKGVHYIPISTYDEQIDILIEELNRVEGIEVSPEYNELRMDTYFQTDINRIQKLGALSHQREAIVDTGFVSTRVGIIDGGRLVEYKEFPNLSGYNLIEYIYNNTDSNLQAIKTRIERYLEISDDSTGEKQLMEEFLMRESQPIREYLIDMKVLSIKMIGGLSNLDFLKGFSVPRMTLTLSEREFPEVPRNELYKIVYNQATDHEGSILDPRNIELLSPKEEIIEEPEPEPEPEIIEPEPEPEHEEKVIRFKPKPIKKAPKPSKKAKKVEPQRMDEIEFVEIKIPRPLKPSPRDIKYLKYENLHKYEDSIYKRTMEPLPEHIKQDIQEKKEKYTEPPHIESKSSVVLTGVLSLMLSLSFLFMLHYSGRIEMRMFEMAGIATETTVASLQTREDALVDFTKSTAKKMGIPSDALIINSRPNTRMRSLEFEVNIPEDLTKVDEFRSKLRNGLEAKDYKGNWDIESFDANKGFYKIVVKGKL